MHGPYRAHLRRWHVATRCGCRLSCAPRRRRSLRAAAWRRRRWRCGARRRRRWRRRPRAGSSEQAPCRRRQAWSLDPRLKAELARALCPRLKASHANWEGDGGLEKRSKQAGRLTCALRCVACVQLDAKSREAQEVTGSAAALQEHLMAVEADRVKLQVRGLLKRSPALGGHAIVSEPRRSTCLQCGQQWPDEWVCTTPLKRAQLLCWLACRKR